MHTTRMVPAIPIGSAIDRGSLVLRAELPARVEAVNRAASARRDQPILVLCVESLESQARLDEAATHTQSTRFTLVLHCTLRVRMQDIPDDERKQASFTSGSDRTEEVAASVPPSGPGSAKRRSEAELEWQMTEAVVNPEGQTTLAQVRLRTNALASTFN